jgi:Ca2+-binding EF-hand superfamily protein
MSRRTLSFPNTGLNLSPLKTHSKAQSKPLRSSEARLPCGKVSIKPSGFISSLKKKLKEKYQTLPTALKKLSDQYQGEISFSQFKILLKSLSFKYNESDLKDFFKQFRKREKNSTLSIDSLSKCLDLTIPKLSTPSAKLIRTHTFSTRSSTKILEETFSSLNLTIPCQKSEESPSISTNDYFFDYLIQHFSTPEQATDYFFLFREDPISLEDFSSSLQNLDFPREAQIVFASLCQRGPLKKSDFFQILFNHSCVIQDDSSRFLQLFRSKLQSFFTSHLKAFQEISSSSGLVTLEVLEEVSQKLGLFLEKEQIQDMFSRYDPGCCLNFKQFKVFWLGKEGICAVKSCEESTFESFSFCSEHFHCLANRGEEIFTKLQIIMKPGHLVALSEEVLKESKTRGFLVNGFELQGKDVQALREFLKFHGFQKRRNASSVKSRVY